MLNFSVISSANVLSLCLAGGSDDFAPTNRLSPMLSNPFPVETWRPVLSISDLYISPAFANATQPKSFGASLRDLPMIQGEFFPNPAAANNSSRTFAAFGIPHLNNSRNADNPFRSGVLSTGPNHALETICGLAFVDRAYILSVSPG